MAELCVAADWESSNLNSLFVGVGQGEVAMRATTAMNWFQSPVRAGVEWSVSIPGRRNSKSECHCFDLLLVWFLIQSQQ